MQKIFDFIVELACWLGIVITLLVVFDVMHAEITFNQTIENIPPIVYNQR
jgi:hypothetical protein